MSSAESALCNTSWESRSEAENVIIETTSFLLDINIPQPS
jgi:hypothetical protein